MQLDRLRRTALAVAVLSAVGAIASGSGAGPTTDFALGSAPVLVGADTSASGPTGISGVSGVSGPSGSTGETGETGDTSATGDSGSTGASGATSATGDSGSTGASGATGASGSTGVSGATTPDGSTGPTGPTSADTATLTTAPTDATGPPPSTLTSTGPGGTPVNHHHHHHHHAKPTVAVPLVTGETAQPQSGLGPATARHHHHNGAGGGSSIKLGPSAPSPALFAGENPLAGVLPGSWEDPFIVPGGTVVPQYLIDIFHVPPFLLPIYESAGSAYGVPWQVLAAINEVETDYGTNLDISSAGAIGWMQFLPSTWRRYGVDASSSGVRDPYNAADAIFAAARYLAAAGAVHNLPGAIFAYNHSWGYVRSVLLRAQVLSGEPGSMVEALSELGEGDFPIQLAYHATYGAESSGASSAAASATALAAGAAPAPGAVGALTAGKVRANARITIYARTGAAVVAVQDGTIIAKGRNRTLGRFVELRNAFGDVFVYGHLSSVSAWYPAPRRARHSHTSSALRPAALAAGPHPNGAAASAGSQHGHKPVGATLFTSRAPVASATDGGFDTVAAPAAPAPVTLNLRSTVSPVDLFTSISLVNGALARARASATTPSAPAHALARPSLLRYFTSALGLRPSQVELAQMRVGSRVLAGTILGRVAATHTRPRAALLFELRPAGQRWAIDPRPFLDSWSQLETLELHRLAFGAQLFGADDHPASTGALLVASQVDLARTVLEDHRVTVPACERTAITSGGVDRRGLASLELIAASGLHATVSGAWCLNARSASTAPALLRTGNAIAIEAHATPSTIDAEALRFAHDLRALGGVAVAARADRDLIVISFAPAHQPEALAAAASFTGGFALSQTRWATLDSRLTQIREPRVPSAISAVALRDAGATRHSHTH